MLRTILHVPIQKVYSDREVKGDLPDTPHYQDRCKLDASQSLLGQKTFVLPIELPSGIMSPTEITPSTETQSRVPMQHTLSAMLEAHITIP